MICMPPQRPAVPNFGFAGAVFNPSVTDTVPLAGGWVTVTVTPRALHPPFQNVGRESTNSKPESTVRLTVPGEVGASSSANAASATSRGPVAPPSNYAVTMIARVMIDPSVAPNVGSPIGRRRSGGGSRRYDNVTSPLANVPYGTSSGATESANRLTWGCRLRRRRRMSQCPSRVNFDQDKAGSSSPHVRYAPKAIDKHLSAGCREGPSADSSAAKERKLLRRCLDQTLQAATCSAFYHGRFALTANGVATKALTFLLNPTTSI